MICGIEYWILKGSKKEKERESRYKNTKVKGALETALCM